MIKRKDIKMAMAIDKVPAKNESNDKFFEDFEKVKLQYQIQRQQK
jgi:hypothetical protein